MSQMEKEESIYVKLREFLDGLPGGFPATESGTDIEYLKWMFTEQGMSYWKLPTSSPWPHQ